MSEDLNYCLLVQSYFARCSWGFPKGKINENEEPLHCAVREVRRLLFKIFVIIYYINTKAMIPGFHEFHSDFSYRFTRRLVMI